MILETRKNIWNEEIYQRVNPPPKELWLQVYFIQQRKRRAKIETFENRKIEFLSSGKGVTKGIVKEKNYQYYQMSKADK